MTKDIDIHALYQSLHTANWGVAARTYGSSHATLIGLLVEWWIRQNPITNTALDGAPSHGQENAGWCDIMYCCDDIPIGILEVEGTKPSDKLRTIGNYFSTQREEMSGIQFGMLLVYSYLPKGRGSLRDYPLAETKEIHHSAVELSSAYPSKPIILIATDKIIDIHESKIRSISPYYAGVMHKVSAVLLSGGHEIRREILFNLV